MVDIRPIIVIDDERTLHIDEQVVHLRSSREARNYFAWHGGEPFILFLDHDMGGDDTTVEFVRWLVLHVPREVAHMSTIYIHSMNGVGADNLMRELELYFSTHRIPLPDQMWVDTND